MHISLDLNFAIWQKKCAEKKKNHFRENLFLSGLFAIFKKSRKLSPAKIGQLLETVNFFLLFAFELFCCDINHNRPKSFILYKCIETYSGNMSYF